MTEFYQELNETLQAFISRQKIFFVATVREKGPIHLSPKSSKTLCCIDKKTVAYLDLMGTGNETAINLDTDRRMTIMFCSFDKGPMILRLYGKGDVICQDDRKWNAYFRHFSDIPEKRQIIILDIDSAQTSCGTSVPLYEFKGERAT
ncbi:MAG: pyridoxamine 5'-phosphate oxidase family protein [Candidatus Brocadiaceae bacterium]|nr:pyridoxamine 5'-phosphate oxidase family protein [Candidatus Brocadiaceae bacterium]